MVSNLAAHSQLAHIQCGLSTRTAMSDKLMISSRGKRRMSVKTMARAERPSAITTRPMCRLSDFQPTNVRSSGVMRPL